MSTVLQARELTRHYSISRGLFKPAALVQALNGVSFTLEAGRTLGWLASPAAASPPWHAP